MVILGFLGASLLMWLLAWRHWEDLNSNDLGFMSQQWLAEYNAQHP